MNIKQEIIDSINIIAEHFKNTSAQINFGVVVSVQANKKCLVKINGINYSIAYYGSNSPTINAKYPVYIPYGDMSLAFIQT